jgi:hypothetical protein
MKIPNWLLGLGAIVVIAIMLGVKIPTLAIAGAALSTANPQVPPAQVCELKGGQTGQASITTGGVILGQENYVIGTPIYSGMIDGQSYTAQAAGTAVTRDWGSGYSLLLGNASLVMHPILIEGTVPCGVVNYVLGESSSNNKLAPVSGLTLTGYDDDSITLNSVTNQTMGASYSGTLRIRMQTNSTYGLSNVYFTNPQINKFAVLVNVNPAIYNATTMNGATTIDFSQMRIDVDGAPCARYSGTSQIASNNMYSAVFECATDVNSGVSEHQMHVRVQAISGQNPAGFLQFIVLPYDYYAGTGSIKAGFETQAGALVSPNGAVVTYQIS